MSSYKQRTETDAFQAKEKFNEMFYDNESFCYKPWQFTDFKVCPDTLKTTYDEIIIWGQQEAMIRPGWKIDNNQVVVPNLFSKVNGIHKDIKLYRDEINTLIDRENTLFFKRFPLYKKTPVHNIVKLYSSFLNNNEDIDKERLLSSPYWKYKELKPSTQELIADRIAEFCKIHDFWKYRNFKIKINLSLIDKFLNSLSYSKNKTTLDEKLMKISIFEILTNLDRKFLNLLQNFDYPMEIPKLILYHNRDSRTFTFADAVILMFLNTMGVDIVIYSPGGTSNIENFVKSQYFDVHMLEEINNDLPYKKRTIFYRLLKYFKRIFGIK